MEIRRMEIPTRISGSNGDKRVKQITPIVPINNDTNPNSEWQQKNKEPKKNTFQDYLKQLSK